MLSLTLVIKLNCFYRYFFLKEMETDSLKRAEEAVMLTAAML